MKTIVMIAVAALIALPAVAADFSGTGEFEDGRADTCLGTSYKITIDGSSVRARVIPFGTQSPVVRDASGSIDQSGHITMDYVAGYGSSSGRVVFDLQLNGDTITGHSQSATCRYKVTATRS